MKKKIEIFDYAKEILTQLEKGVLVTSKVEDKVNHMTIAWGNLGIEWNKKIFTIFIKESRFTKEQLDKNPEFTINIPRDRSANKILGYCGSRSGRDVNKTKELGLHLEKSENISVPGVRELPLTLECRIIYKQKQEAEKISYENLKKHYPEYTENRLSDNFHTAYYGEIVAAYLID